MDLKEITVVAAIIYNSKNQILITKRPKGFHLGGLWEFPGGKVDNGESFEKALIREIKEETNLEIFVHDLFWQESVTYTKKHVNLKFYYCSLTREDQTIVKNEIDDFKWAYCKELANFSFPKADRKLISHLAGTD